MSGLLFWRGKCKCHIEYHDTVVKPALKVNATFDNDVTKSFQYIVQR